MYEIISMYFLFLPTENDIFTYQKWIRDRSTYSYICQTLYDIQTKAAFIDTLASVLKQSILIKGNNVRYFFFKKKIIHFFFSSRIQSKFRFFWE